MRYEIPRDEDGKELFNKPYFEALTDIYMSPYATNQEERIFLQNLKKSASKSEVRFLRKKSIGRQASLREFNKMSHYFYVWQADKQEYHLHYKEGNKVGYNLHKHEYARVTDAHAYAAPLTQITYLKYRDMTPKPESFKGKENYEWSRIRVQKINYTTHHLKAQILARYAMFRRPTNGLSNVVVDSFIPKLMYQTDFEVYKMRNESNLPSTAVTISPWFAQMFGIKQIETEQMCRILGYTKKDIKTLLVNAKRQEHSIAFVGYGGTGVNTIHWLTQLCTMTHTLNLFKHMAVFEKDTLEVSNLLRFPKNPEAIYNTSGFGTASKLNLLTDHEANTLSKNKATLTPGYVTKNNVGYGKYQDYIFYGAPDFDTREMFSVNDYKFISATHTGNSAYMHINPTIDSDITLETYGLIQLSIFFMNQLKLAITLLETLANPEIDFTAHDVELLDYTFSQHDTLTTDRKYNFQLDHDGNMVTEEEANAVV